MGRWRRRGTCFAHRQPPAILPCNEIDMRVQIVEFPAVAGYPLGGDLEIKYYMIQMHYDNPLQQSSMIS